MSPDGGLAAPIVDAKTRVPDVPANDVLRRRLFDPLDRAERVALIVAPAGYGKTVLARHWVATTTEPAAWLSIDFLDDNPVSFWLHYLRAVRSVLPVVDDEAEMTFLQNIRSETFLAVLASQIERAQHRATVVLDDLSSLSDPAIYRDLALLVARVGHRLRHIVTARSAVPFPVPAWTTAGWVTEVGADQLRLTGDEVAALAGALGVDAGAPLLRALGERYDGWPLGTHLALLVRSDPEAGHGGTGEGAAARLDERLADVLATSILERLDPQARHDTLALSIVDWFDAEVAQDLVGPHAAALLDELERRGMPIQAVVERPGARAFHRLVRELLASRLRWSDPARHAELHRRAARTWAARGNLIASYHHLRAAGDATAQLLLEPALAMIDRGDRAQLARMLGSYPKDLEVDDPALALDLAICWLFAGHRAAAQRWCEHAAALAGTDPAIVLRVHSTRAILALLDGDLDGATDQTDRFLALESTTATDGPMERSFATVGMRTALATGDLTAARRWVERWSESDAPEVIRTITMPALRAWYELTAGRLTRAKALIADACDRAMRAGARPHHGVIDALVTAVWIDLAIGEVATATEWAQLAREDAELLGLNWNRLRAGVADAEAALALGDATRALAVARDVRTALDPPLRRGLIANLDITEAKTLYRLGRADEAAALLDASPATGARARLVRAQIAIVTGSDPHPALDGWEAWNPAQRFAAEALLAVVDREQDAALASAVRRAGEAGWVLPFYGLPPAVHAALLDLPLERIHPKLATLLRPAPPVARRALVEELTSRELTIVELLPTHLSYVQIGARLYLSVNTVKSNLKAVYRKLGVATRSEAVDAARDLGML